MLSKRLPRLPSLILGIVLGAAAFAPIIADASSVDGLLVSRTRDRAAPVPLAGGNLSGDVYIFFSSSSTNISEVRFYLDDPNRSRRPIWIEKVSPWDFAGGSKLYAKPFDASTLSAGSHTVTADRRSSA